MAKLDLKKDLKHLYRASAKQAVQVEVPPLQFLMIDGQGDPNTSREYQDAVEALFSVAYTAKFLIKRGEFRCRLRRHAARRIVVGRRFVFVREQSAPGLEVDDDDPAAGLR